MAKEAIVKALQDCRVSMGEIEQATAGFVYGLYISKPTEKLSL